MKIDHKTFTPYNNYVLIKPDDNFETYQRAGVDLGIIAPDFKYENGKVLNVKERNYSVQGTVYASCASLEFHQDTISALRRKYTTHRPFIIQGTKKNYCINKSVQNEIDRYYAMSANFKSEVEIKKGDRVNFSYMAHQRCLQEGRVFETDLGMMYLIKYDMLYFTITEDNEPLKMLNGFIVVEPELVELDKIEMSDGDNSWQIEGTQTSTGLIIPNAKKIKKTRKNQIGIVKYFGTPCTGYLQQPGVKDPEIDLEKDMRILYDPRGSTLMEYENHQLFSGKPLSLIQRKDIWLTEKTADLDLIKLD